MFIQFQGITGSGLGQFILNKGGTREEFFACLDSDHDFFVGNGANESIKLDVHLVSKVKNGDGYIHFLAHATIPPTMHKIKSITDDIEGEVSGYVIFSK